MSRPTKDQPIVATSSELRYQNKWITVREDKTLDIHGVEGIYGVVETNNSVVVGAVNDRNEIYLIRGYSYPSARWVWEVPGGGGDGQAPIVAAARELREETGIEAAKLEVLGDLIVSCGILKEMMAVVVASNLTLGERPVNTDDANEISEGKFVSIETIDAMIANGEICDSQSISAIYLIRKWIQEHGN